MKKLRLTEVKQRAWPAVRGWWAGLNPKGVWCLVSSRVMRSETTACPPPRPPPAEGFQAALLGFDLVATSLKLPTPHSCSPGASYPPAPPGSEHPVSRALCGRLSSPLHTWWRAPSPCFRCPPSILHLLDAKPWADKDSGSSFHEIQALVHPASGPTHPLVAVRARDTRPLSLPMTVPVCPHFLPPCHPSQSFLHSS